MGLDQYAYAREADEDSDANVEIAYWRKHNRLHGHMEALWQDKGNELGQEAFGNDFNCVELELTESDIEQLEAFIEHKNLPETGGFFFGDDSYSYEDENDNANGGYFHKKADLQFIEDARKAFSEGKKVYYNSWW